MPNHMNPNKDTKDNISTSSISPSQEIDLGEKSDKIKHPISCSIENLLSDKVKSIPPSAIRRFFDLANEMKEQVISLSIGEPDFVTPWAIREAGIFSIEQGHTHYSPNQGFLELRQAISQYMLNRFNLHYNHKSEIMVTVGGSEGLDLMMRALLNPGDEAILIEPCFVAYKSTILMSQGVPVIIETTAQNKFKLCAEDLEKAITPKTKLLILGYPSNPTGAVMEKEDYYPIVQILEKYPKIQILSDEIYSELTYSGEHYSIANFVSMYERTLIINGFSKAFAMTGWRLGFACGTAPLIAAMNKIHQYCIMSSPTVAQYAAIEALNNGKKAVLQMKDEYNQRRLFILKFFQEHKIACFIPQGAFYVYPSIKESGLSSEEFCQRFLQEHKVAIVPGNAFGECGEGHVRISYAASLDDIKEALLRFAIFINQLKQKIHKEVDG